MSDKYELNYFEGKGRAEFMRLIMAQAGIEFADKRHTREEWQKIKPSMHFSAIL